jgi:hypothetical protein
MEHGHRYLLISEDEESSKKTRICTNCAESKGMAAYITEKGEQVLTFFSDELKPKEKKGKETKLKETVTKVAKGGKASAKPEKKGKAKTPVKEIKVKAKEAAVKETKKKERKGKTKAKSNKKK